MDNVKVTILGQQGFILNRYMVYEVKSEVRFLVDFLDQLFMGTIERARAAAVLGVRHTMGVLAEALPLPPDTRFAAKETWS